MASDSGGKESNQVSIFADHRESVSNVSRHLQDLGAAVHHKQLQVGDYIASERVGIERKTTSDFLTSMTSQKIFRQLEELSGSFECPVLIMEGSPSNLFSNGIHPNAIRGALSSISVDYKIPMVWASNPRETAAQIYRMAFREQVDSDRTVSIRGCKRPVSDARKQEFIVAGLPSINAKMSARLLEHFGSVRAVFSASEKELTEVDMIGKKKAKQIFDILNREYK